MITTKELKEWKDKIVQTKDKAERLSDDYDQDMVEYYEHLFEVSKIQLALIDRLISQSEGMMYAPKPRLHIATMGKGATRASITTNDQTRVREDR